MLEITSVWWTKIILATLLLSGFCSAAIPAASSGSSCDTGRMPLLDLGLEAAGYAADRAREKYGTFDQVAPTSSLIFFLWQLVLLPPVNRSQLFLYQLDPPDAATVQASGRYLAAALGQEVHGLQLVAAAALGL